MSGHNKQKFQLGQSYSYITKKVYYHQIWIQKNLGFMVLTLIHKYIMKYFLSNALMFQPFNLHLDFWKFLINSPFVISKGQLKTYWLYKEPITCFHLCQYRTTDLVTKKETLTWISIKELIACRFCFLYYYCTMLHFDTIMSGDDISQTLYLYHVK